MDAWKLRTGRRYAGICPGFAFLQHNPTILSNAQHKAHTQCDVSLQKGLRSMLTQMLWREHLVMCSEINIILIVIIIIISAIGLRVDARLLSSYPFLTILFYFFFCIFRPISGRVLWRTLRRSCAFCSIFGFGSCAMRRTTPTQFQGTGSEVGSGSKSG